MASMDIFNGSAFRATTLTTAINRRPFVPSFLGSLNIFTPKPVRTVTVALEQKNGKLSLIQTSERGAPLEQADSEKRDIRDFRTVRVAKGDTLHAYEIESIRDFGTESELMQVQKEVAARLARLDDDLQLTHENMMLGAIQGIVLDADGSVIRNWYNEFGIAQPAEIDFELDDAATDVRGKCQQVVRSMQRAAKGSWLPGTQAQALAGDDFYDKLISHPHVRDTYLNQQAAAELREGRAFESFRFGGITFNNYRGTDDNTTVAIAPDKAKFYPVGGKDVFEVAQSPGETFDFVNTPGQRTYAMLVPDRDRNAWVKPEVYSYPLYICTTPGMLQRAKAY
ncbi:major capsid protein [Paracidovorax wautersii]|uniref:Phage major capsid protein E n=1 Tax=Paracidovorax wautersii TaxID=1177982 RepID=A0A1I2E7M6_9BURK|nr:major capsid protein [Paracidovorax wautersii]SFE88707.1 Phage major capsid protein E [Paracidovorax wautersii]